MAHSCVSSSLRFNSSSVSLSSPNLNSSPSSRTYVLPFRPLRSRHLGKSVVQGASVRAVYSPEFYARRRSSGNGIWSIRDDLRCEQVPSPMVQQRIMNLTGPLFQHRIIRCSGEVQNEMANMIVAQLLYLDAVDPTKGIVMYINSPGGSVTAGMAIFDTMRRIRPDVSTVCVGLAASIGAFLLSAGTKGKRYGLPNSRMMIHQPIGAMQGSMSDAQIQVDEVLYHKTNLSGYLAYHTGQSLEKIDRDTNHDFFMSATEAKEYGLIDNIIVNPLKTLQPLAAA